VKKLTKVTKDYNKSFKVEITANMIADKFISNLDPSLSSERAEKFVDCIIGPMCSNDNTNGLKHLYYGLFDLDMDAPLYKESDDLLCNARHYHYVGKQKAGMQDGDEMEIEYIRENEVIGQCKLIGFDPYRNGERYQIQYQEMDRHGDTMLSTKWIDAEELELASDNVEEKTGE
jgi:hypothetical protein